MKGLMKTLTIFLLVLALAACGSNNGGSNNSKADSNSNGSSNVNNSSATNEEIKNEKLIVYTNANSNGRGEWWIEKAKEAGFEIDLVTAGGGDVTNRLIAEKNNPIADVVFGLNNIFYENLKKEEAFIQYVPQWASQVEAGLNDPEGYYHGLVKQAILLGYNSELITPETAPADWTDLYTNEAFKGKYEAPTYLDRTTPRLVVASILTQFQDENGDLGIAEEGWDALKQLYSNGVRIPDGEDLYANMASGKVPIGILVSGERAKKEEEYGVKTGFVSPEIGVPMVVEHIAIVNGTKKLDTAQRFVEWFGTAEIQGSCSEEF